MIYKFFALLVVSMLCSSAVYADQKPNQELTTNQQWAIMLKDMSYRLKLELHANYAQPIEWLEANACMYPQEAQSKLLELLNAFVPRIQKAIDNLVSRVQVADDSIAEVKQELLNNFVNYIGEYIQEQAHLRSTIRAYQAGHNYTDAQ